MQPEIDRAAGTIWRYLNEHSETTLTKLKQGTRLSDQLLFAGIGWLAREEKLAFTTQGRRVRSLSAGASASVIPGRRPSA